MTLKRLNKYLTIAFVALLALGGWQIGQASAASYGGLLAGKTMNIGKNLGTVESTSSMVTDGDESTRVILGPASYAWFDLANETTIDSARIYQTGFKYLELYDDSGNMLYSLYMDQNQSYEFNPVEHVKRVVLHYYGSSYDTSLYEFDVVGFDAVAPSAPQDLHAQNVTSGNVTLSWTASTDNAGGNGLRGYYIYRDGVRMNTTPMVGTTYAISGLADNVRYSWQVSAVDNDGNESTKSTPLLTLFDTIPPLQPVGLAAIVGENDAELSWYANSEPDLAGYMLYLNNVGINVTPHTDTTYYLSGLETGKSYIFGVSAIDTSNNASTAATIPLTPHVPDVVPPAVPTGLTGKDDNTSVILKWDANSEPDLNGYNLYRDGKKINNLPLKATSFTDTMRVKGKSYSYQIAAVDTSGNASARSEAVVVTLPMPLGTTPKVKANLTADDAATISWQPVAGATYYRVYRDGVQIASLPGLEYVDSGLTLGTAYTYQVSAFVDGVESPLSSPVRVTPGTSNVGHGSLGVGFKDILGTAFGFIKSINGYVLFVLGAMFAPFLIWFLLWMFRGFPKLDKQQPKRKRTPKATEGKHEFRDRYSNASQTIERQEERLRKQGRIKDADDLSDRNREMIDRHIKERHALGKKEGGRYGDEVSKERQALRNRQVREVRAMSKESRESERSSRESRSGRSGRNGRS